jgi:hypothetical protein
MYSLSSLPGFSTMLSGWLTATFCFTFSMAVGFLASSWRAGFLSSVFWPKR